MSAETVARQSTLDARIEELAKTPNLLVASDYDGTLSPIVSDPAKAAPSREAMIALRALSELDQTHVAVISGRALKDLAALTSLPPSVHLVGSHGSEFDVGFAERLSSADRHLLERVERELADIAGSIEGAALERKPASIALHYRNAPGIDEDALLERVLTDGPGRLEGVHEKLGKCVIELTVVETNKGKALQTMRRRVGASAVIFLGDDVTDEDVFADLCGPDVGVKVGEGDTAAAYRVAATDDVARLLARLAELREAWLAGSQWVPIEDHALLSDLRTVALVEPDATISYFCVPRIDSPAIFAKLLGGPTAGYFSIRPETASAPTSQHYVQDSMVLRTDFPTMSVTDFLDCGGGRTSRRAGRTDLVRIIEGTGRAVVEFVPRLDFGRLSTEIVQRDGGLEIQSPHEPIVLRAPEAQWEIFSDAQHQWARATIELGNGPVELSLRFGSGTMRAAQRSPESQRDETIEFWNAWARTLNVPDVEPDLVRRSALALRALVYGPTGAIAAAATTSLPEEIGGVRNWDYRFCWPRDAAISALALTKLGSQSEAMAFLDWSLGVLERTASPDQLHPLYTVTGDALGSEGEISELSGYAGSRPVRIGNAAANQIQLDVFGPVAELVLELARRDAPLTPAHWHLVEAMVAGVQARWAEPDHGIWEVRARRRHHVHSKLMCWCTIDRAIETSRLLRDRAPDAWLTLRDDIARDILDNGWNEKVGAFTATYDADELDSACLLIGLTGLLPPDDPRVAATVAAIEADLLVGPGVFRYRFDDGLPGYEGAFLISTCWLILAKAQIGQHDEANELFAKYVALAGPTGLLAEQCNVETGAALGNFPQAYSHAGLIECALALSAIR